MAEYKCISCGEIKSGTKSCSCPKCGYRMFKTPFDRTEVFKREIGSFLHHLRLSEIPDDAYEFYRFDANKHETDLQNEEPDRITKEDDDERFPSFGTIHRYVCSATKTELLFERLNESIQQIRAHLQTSYQQQYEVDAGRLLEELESRDAVLSKALSVLELELSLPVAVLPKLTVSYSEIPDPFLLPIAEDLLDDALQLARKVYTFIRQNNIYGTSYRELPVRKITNADPDDGQKALSFCKKQITRVLTTKYTIDLMSDGYDELAEMLSSLWGVLEAVMCYPVLSRQFEFHFEDGTIADDRTIDVQMLQRINCRYSVTDQILDDPSFLADRTEEALFQIYDQMIELDQEGFMGINKSKLFKVGESEKKLNAMIGLSGIKESILKIKAHALMNKDNGNLNLHMCFLGNPGSGKTEVARFVADILYENNILPTNKFIEVDRSGLVSQYFGATAEKTSQVIKKAMGGVLFIDEAYALGNNADTGGISDYGKEAIDTLVKAMEDYRGKFCVILAGYRNEMQQMMSVNPGFRSRVQFTLDFPNYSREELKEITLFMLEKRKYTIDDTALNRILDITDIKRKDSNFANAREIRNILDQVIMCQNLRCVGTEENELGLVDVNKYIQENKINLPSATSSSSGSIQTGEEELEQLIGLDTVKRMVKKIKAYAKRNQGQTDFTLHMCFYGNPGTGKTEVARILSRILYDAEVLDEAKLVETDAHGLMGKYVGETAPKTQQKINEAMGGVLFIDEAYALTTGLSSNGSNTSYGDEAIAVLLKEMEDRRGQFCTILAGYKNEMKEMLSSNPGMESRVQFTLEFPDYTREELGLIALKFLKKKKYDIEEKALNRFLDIMEYYRKQPNFANARTVRNVLDQVIMNQNLRTEDEVGNRQIVLSDVEDYLIDEQIDINKQCRSARRIGFV